MSSNSSPVIPLVLAALTAVGVAAGIGQLGNVRKDVPEAQVAKPPKPRWTASAPGRVEPKGGEIKLSALSAGRIENVLVKVNDTVKAGDLLVRIDDIDAVARVLGADAEAGVRKRERDSESNVPKLTQERRTAEDRLNNTERAISLARQELDRLLLAQHADKASVKPEQIAEQRKALEDALKRLPEDRRKHRDSQLASGVPLPTRLEAGLTASRAELTLAEAALERTRIRAPMDATVLQVMAHVGETAAASPEQTMVVLGDISSLRIRAEVEERDISKVSIGQEVVLKTDAFAGREFKGRVTSIARAVRPPKLPPKGARRPSDLDSLEVMIDLEPGTPLLPGLRVDAFFAEPPVVTGSSDAAPKAVPPVASESSAPSPAAGKN